MLGPKDPQARVTLPCAHAVPLRRLDPSWRTTEGGPVPDHAPGAAQEEHFKPKGTIAVVGLFVATLILLWLSIYLILIARGVTV